MLLIASSAYNFFYSIASSAVLVPYALSAFYQLKYLLEQDQALDRGKNIVIGMIASIYACCLLFSIGTNYALLMMILFAVAISVYVGLQRHDNQKARIFSRPELILVVIISLAVVAVQQIIVGKITF